MLDVYLIGAALVIAGLLTGVFLRIAVMADEDARRLSHRVAPSDQPTNEPDLDPPTWLNVSGDEPEREAARSSGLDAEFFDAAAAAYAHFVQARNVNLQGVRVAFNTPVSGVVLVDGNAVTVNQAWLDKVHAAVYEMDPSTPAFDLHPELQDSLPIGDRRGPELAIAGWKEDQHEERRPSK